jgi:hypothetical protein
MISPTIRNPKALRAVEHPAANYSNEDFPL